MKKYEREIRELLEKMDSFVPEAPAQEKERNREREPEREPRKRPVGVMPPQPIPIKSRRSSASGFSQWLTEHHVGTGLRLMALGFLIVVAAVAIRENFGPRSSLDLTWLAQLVGAIGALVFISPVLIRFFRGKGLDNGPQYWRGQEVESDNFSWASLRRWIGGRKRPKNDPWNDRNRNNRRW